MTLRRFNPALAVPATHEIHGFAIVSADGMIADATGAMPAELRNDADWAYFQAELDRSQLVLVGRRSHEAAPSTGRRKRVVMSRSVPSLLFRDAVWWWNPATLSLHEALQQLLPDGGRVAVPGGQAVFDLLGRLRAFDAFHLSRALNVRLPGGHALFSAQAPGVSVESVLRRQGLRHASTQTLDPIASVTVALWCREARPPEAARVD